MDKVKQDIEEIIRLAIKTKEQELATNALTALIIKWLEKGEKHFIFCASEKGGKCNCGHFSCNQLITELIEELNENY